MYRRDWNYEQLFMEIKNKMLQVIAMHLIICMVLPPESWCFPPRGTAGPRLGLGPEHHRVASLSSLSPPPFPGCKQDNQPKRSC